MKQINIYKVSHSVYSICEKITSYQTKHNTHYLIRDIVSISLEHKTNLLINDVHNQIIGAMERLRMKGELK